MGLGQAVVGEQVSVDAAPLGQVVAEVVAGQHTPLVHLLLTSVQVVVVQRPVAVPLGQVAGQQAPFTHKLLPVQVLVPA